jgi:hypothetical protein
MTPPGGAIVIPHQWSIASQIHHEPSVHRGGICLHASPHIFLEDVDQTSLASVMVAITAIPPTFHL